MLNWSSFLVALWSSLFRRDKKSILTFLAEYNARMYSSYFNKLVLT
jgi:hypothetical protein